MKIRRLPSGSYNGRVYVGEVDGKKKWISITEKTREEVRRRAEELRGVSSGPVTLGDAISTYLSARQGVLSPYTLKGYRNIQKKLTEANMDDFPAYMTAADAQKIVTVFRGLSPKTIRNRIGLVSAAVRFAGFRMPPVTLPQRVKFHPHTPTEEELRIVVEAAAGTDLEVPIALGMMGLRRGEICALKLSDLNGEDLHVRRAAVDIAGKVTTKTPKTYDSDRILKIPKEVADLIRSQGYVTELTPERLSYAFIGLIRSLDVEHFRFHDLRHFFASYCHNVLKLSDAQIQRLGGWKTDSVMKRVYIESMRTDEAAASAAEGIGSLLV